MTRLATSDEPIENASVVAEEMERWLRDIDGFEGVMTLSREGTTFGLTFWESESAAQRHRTTRMEFLGRMTALAGAEIEESHDYKVTFASLSERVRNVTGEQP